jgi:hypothetical protein
MELPIKKVYDTLLFESSFIALIPAENVFMMKIPEEFRRSDLGALLRIVELSEYQKDHASNRPLSITFSFQLDIWEKDLEKLNEIKNKLDFILNNFNLSKTYGTIIEDEDLPDTLRLISRYQGSESITLN